MHVIAAKAICFHEALEEEFKKYSKLVVDNSKAFADELKKEGFRIVTDGTDNHLFLVDVKSTLNITGKEAEEILDRVNITVNKNTIPFDLESPFKTSGIRLGTPAMTTRGFKEKEFRLVARLISRALKNKDDDQVINEIKMEVIKLLENFKLYE